MISMLIAVIVLVATLLAAIALMRSVDTANVVAGSMTFRQGGVQEAEKAYEAAKALLGSLTTGGESDQPESGYYASVQASTSHAGIPDQLTTDPTYAGAASVVGATNNVRYVVERLCPAAGKADASVCIAPDVSITAGSSANQMSDTAFALHGVTAAFRLTVRVDGPKNTVSFVQTILH
ncbi:hypothetical protein [Rudaea sp.]|uniref:hypothetical protein n=1 Tax=Rudaea sp. TaxID=2136325 RepID=UPI002ED05670